MAGKYAQNELQASLANSLVAAFLESDLDQESASALFGAEPREAWSQSVKQAQSICKLQGAVVIPLPAGARMNSFTPGRPNVAFDAFMLANLGKTCMSHASANAAVAASAAPAGATTTTTTAAAPAATAAATTTSPAALESARAEGAGA